MNTSVYFDQLVKSNDKKCKQYKLFTISRIRKKSMWIEILLVGMIYYLHQQDRGIYFYLFFLLLYTVYHIKSLVLCRYYFWFLIKEAAPRGVLIKKCSGNMQQIYRRTPMLKCDFNFRHGCSPVNLLHIFRTLFPKSTSGGLSL